MRSLVDCIIIGAGKSGTTSLYYYLGQHAGIALSSAKEPCFFCLPGLDVTTTPEERAAFSKEYPRGTSTRTDYEQLFRDARPDQLRGEASIWYLSSETAARNIGRYAPEAKLICVLRNPIERAFSNYLHAVRDGNDPDGSMLAALEKEGVRHFYFDGGFYARQLGWYSEHAPANPLQVWLYEELDREPVRVVQEVFGFLGLDAGFVPDVSFRANVSGVAHRGNVWAALYDWARRSGLRQSPIVRRFLSAERKQRALKLLAGKADAGRTKPYISREEWDALYEIYKDDLEKLENLLGRDLSGWRAFPGSSSSSITA